jgi:hypothetical protein
MRKNNAELEQAINNSPFFTLPKENWPARKTAKARLMNDLWEYCKNRPVHLGNPNNETYQDYGLEVVEGMERSIGKFDPNIGGPFLHYFNAYFKRFFIKILRHQETENNQNAFKPDSGNTILQYNSEETIFDMDMIEDSDNEYHRAMPTPAEALEKKETSPLIITYLEILEKAFLEKQKRIQPRLRTLWTLRCFNALASIDFSGKKYAWIDYDFLDKYQNAKKLPTQKEVAELYGKSEQAASRDLALLCEIVGPRFQEALKNK